MELINRKSLTLTTKLLRIKLLVMFFCSCSKCSSVDCWISTWTFFHGKSATLIQFACCRRQLSKPRNVFSRMAKTESENWLKIYIIDDFVFQRCFTKALFPKSIQQAAHCSYTIILVNNSYLLNYYQLSLLWRMQRLFLVSPVNYPGRRPTALAG